MKTNYKKIVFLLALFTVIFSVQSSLAQNDTMRNNMEMKTDKTKMNDDKMKMNNDKMKMKDDDMKMKMKDDKMKMKMDMSSLKSWPMASQMAVQEQMGKYGQPNEITPTMMIWYNNGVFAKTIITKMESVHDFPKTHTDMMEQSIMHKVPLDMYDDLARFDGSVTIDRTQGLLAARCDKEENNLLALNLAHDIIMGTKTVEAARQAFTDIIGQSMKGTKHEYMQKLMFTPGMNAPDKDVVTLKM